MKLLEYRHQPRGPRNEDLRTRYFYNEPKPTCIIHVSGVHGVEGRLGLLVQQEILKQNLDQLPVQTVIVQTVNPFAMAWNRRANFNNVDLNRNSLSEYKIKNPHFLKLKPFLDSGRFSDFLKITPDILKIGIAETVQSAACGQTEFPESLFYAGRELQPELQSLEQHLRQLIAPGTQVFVIDVHTGLGQRGQETLILSGFDCDHDQVAFQKAFQTPLVYPGKSRKSYRADGSLGLLMKRIWGPDKTAYICQEFGTRPVHQVLKALIDENHFFQNSSNMSDHERDLTFEKSSQKMLNAFFPDDSQWRQSCVELGLLRFNQMVQDLS